MTATKYDVSIVEPRHVRISVYREFRRYISVLGCFSLSFQAPVYISDVISPAPVAVAVAVLLDSSQTYHTVSPPISPSKYGAVLYLTASEKHIDADLSLYCTTDNLFPDIPVILSLVSIWVNLGLLHSPDRYL